MNIFGSDDEDEEDTEYICDACGEPWEGEATAFYVDGRCTHCKASGSAHKVPADRDNPLTREGEDGD